MCLDLERWGVMDEVREAVRRTDEVREREVRALLDAAVPAAAEAAPAAAGAAPHP